MPCDPRLAHVPLCGSFSLIADELQGRAVIDLGCGPGDYLQFAGPGSLGVELNATEAAQARARGLQVVAHDLNQPPLPLAACRFDVALLSHVMEHVHAPLYLLREANRLLRPGGRLIVGLPIEDNLYSRLRMDYYGGPEGHLYSFSPRNLDKLLAICGFARRRLLCHLPRIGNRLDAGSSWLNRQLNRWVPAPLVYAVSAAYWCVADKVGAPLPDAHWSSAYVAPGVDSSTTGDAAG